MEHFTEIENKKIPFDNCMGIYISNPRNNKYFIFGSYNNSIKVDYYKLIPSLISDYFQGYYTKVPFKTILSLMSLLYFVIKPKKKISEKITVFKTIKYISLSLFILRSIKDDLIKYQIWKNNQITPEVKIRVN